MIVTFQVALYLTYQLWENYLSFYFGNTEVNETNDVHHLNTDSTMYANPDSHPTAASEPEPEVNSRNEPNLTSEPKAGPSSALNHNGRNQQMEEGDGDLHSCLYNVDDTFDDSENDKKPIDKMFACHYIEGKEIRFIPPAYTQRYMVIEDVLKEKRWSNVKKVVDFGCAELSFEVTYLKKLFNIQEIVAVDVDFEKLDYNKCKLIPNAVDHIDPRPTPLNVKICCGSVGQTNRVLEGCHAVIGIELIEHLYPHDLECLPFTVFGFIKPNIAMFTTPNADFNVLFPDFSGIRHWDHKFEWSRQQFEDWGNNLVNRYPDYIVSYRGITPGPPGSEHLGCLSQMATFVKIHSAPAPDKQEVNIQKGPYTLVQETVFPYYEDRRTKTEIIRDDALSFIQKCAMLSRCSNDNLDEDKRREIPLKNIMERIQCHNRKKLIDILTEEKFEIATNTDGYEVLILPESEDENESFQDLCDISSFDLVDDIPDTNYDYTVILDENWDCEWTNKPPEMTENLSVAFLDAETAFNENNVLLNTTPNNLTTESKEHDTNLTQNINSKEFDGSYGPLSNTDSDVGLFTSQNLSGSDYSTKEMSLEDAQREIHVVDDSLVDGFCNKFSLLSLATDSSVERFSPKDITVSDEGAELECSVYETPFNNCVLNSSNCELYNPSAQSLCQSESTPHGDFKRKLSFEAQTPADSKENPALDVFNSKTDLTKVENVCSMTSVISSPLESSYYATPCCSDINKKCIPKCLSLQQINGSCDSSLFKHKSGKCLASSVKGEKKGNISKSMDGLKSQESCDTHETCSNTSRVIDSGYPDSYSEHNMDLDSTQFDDIETESEGEDLSPRLPSPVEPLAPPLPQRVVDNVENGDVANNNRDGEGNNMVADMEEDFFEFEAQIEEVEVPNFAVPLARDIDKNVKLSDNLLDASCSPLGINCSIYNSPNYSSSDFNSQNKTFKTSNHLKEFLNVEERDHVHDNNTADQQTIKSSQSDSSLVTKSSWSHLDSSESMSDGGVKRGNQWDHSKIGGHNSLTTVLEGCSRFSDCSIVCPIDTSSSVNDDDMDRYGFPKWMLGIDCSVFQAGEGIGKNRSSDSLKALRLQPSQCHLSSPSLYQSLSSTSFESDSEDSVYFPKWLLDIEVSETEESNVASVNSDSSDWDVESDNELAGVPFDVQVDARGGGDPQRDSWLD